MNTLSEQLNIAWNLVKRGSCAAGVDGITTELFAGIAAEQIRLLSRQLHREVYTASPAKGFLLPKPSGGKRLIGIPTVQDRIVQRFLLQSIYPALESQFSDSAFAYRPGLSIYSAVERVMERYRHQPTWVVKADIQQFFDNLSWPLLLHQVERLGIAPAWVHWIEQQLKSGIVVYGHYCRPNKGVLQGGVLSGALANLYLSQFDRQCLAAGIDLVRYGDDCVAVCQSFLEASRSLTLMHGWIGDLYLNLHPEKTRIIGPDEEFIFLGHRFFNGGVQAPERKAQAERRGAEGGGRKKSGGGGRPKVCSIVRSENLRTRTSNPEEYWRDGMTTLYVTDQGAYLRVQHQQFQVFHQNELRCSVPASRVSHVVLFGTCNVSHGAVSLALRQRIPVLYLSTKGKYFGRLQTSGQAKIDYLTQQVQKSLDQDFIRRQSASMIVGKLHNSRILLLRLNRRRKTEKATKAIEELAKLIETVPTVETVEQMLGYEGHGANLYFQAYASLLKGSFEFESVPVARPPIR
ncbi:MAG: CRISPR-associated endonuclease Cas1 [Leptolyngbyaceae cyanobacterium SM1_4_3]|nr:CRISPR-associated endonuclease Cas1 [Leptolyngbyaceae cyanobacterium SM1_4_3]